MKTLDVGCGKSKTEGAIGIDGSPLSDADVICDLETFPWPFDDDTFERVICSHVLEHLGDVIGAMREIHRVSKAGAAVEIETPYLTSWRSWTDPTHRHHFTLRSFDYFVEQAAFGFQYTEPLFLITERRVTFGSSLLDLGAKLIYRLSPHQYEKHCAFIFPGRDLVVKLEAIK